MRGQFEKISIKIREEKTPFPRGCILQEVYPENLLGEGGTSGTPAATRNTAAGERLSERATASLQCRGEDAKHLLRNVDFDGLRDWKYRVMQSRCDLQRHAKIIVLRVVRVIERFWCNGIVKNLYYTALVVRVWNLESVMLFL